VSAAIEVLGYRRNAAATALALGRSRSLGVIALDGTRFGPASTLCGIEEAAFHSQYAVIVTNLRSTDYRTVHDAVNRMIGRGVDGIIILAPLREVARTLRDLPIGLPSVAVEGELGTSIDVVGSDQSAGARIATAHLLDLGHPTVWHIAGPGVSLEANQRAAGWREALERAGAEVPFLLRGDWTARSGFETGRMLARIPEVSAVFVANDAMAVGVLRAFHESSRDVPDDVSLVGFDDIPEGAYFNPPLTTVHQDYGEVGRRSLAVLLDLVECRARASQRHVVDATLVVRGSTARRWKRDACASSRPRPNGEEASLDVSTRPADVACS
jgi:DNA-binding LacI/PurR family transcriptional regulator